MRTSDRDSQSVCISDLAQQLGLEFIGDGSLQVNAVSSFESASESDLCFLSSNKYLSQMESSHCGAVIVPTGFDAKQIHKPLLFAQNPHLSIVYAIDILQPQSDASQQIHPSAQVSSSAQLGQRVTVAANSFIDDNTHIADDVVIGAGCVIEKGAIIGNNTRLLSGVTVCHDVKIGDNVILHPGAVIGSDGFGNVYHQGKWIKIPQLGSVRIGNWVEVGANTTIDRGAMEDTVIEDGVRLDNQIQIAHNVHVGENTAMAACVGVAGSAIIGKNCRISGGCCIMGHLEITDNVTVTAMSMVTKSIKQSGTYSSGTPLMDNRQWHRSNARYKTLDTLAKTVSDLTRKNEES